MSTTVPGQLPISREHILLDDRIRGVPPGTAGIDSASVGAQQWHPAGGLMSLPVLTLDEIAFAGNRDLFLRYAREQGVEIAPHAKTPMAPDLARSLLEAGAWGTTVADIRQASVMLRAGLDRLIIANDVGGAGGASRLASMAAAWPHAEIYVFADSVAAANALSAAWRDNEALSPLRVLVEVGAARAGARTILDAERVADVIQSSGGRLQIAGVATYEGAAAQADPQSTDEVIGGLLALTSDVFLRLRSRVGGGVPLMVTAGGSVYFDKVVSALRPVVAGDDNSSLVLRSGAIFFHDHGTYDRQLGALDARKGFSIAGASVSARSSFRPALRLWAEVLSCPEPALAICGMGMRDVSFDQGFPIVLSVYRAGKLTATSAKYAEVVRLNDQHAFLSVDPADDIAVGDVVEFGISHPCTCLDRYRIIFGVDETGRVRNAFPTHFG